MRESSVTKILGAIKATPKRPRGQQHVRSARRNAEASARYIASGGCSSALASLLSARDALARADASGSLSDVAETRRDVTAVERAFADRCVIRVRS